MLKKELRVLESVIFAGILACAAEILLLIPFDSIQSEPPVIYWEQVVNRSNADSLLNLAKPRFDLPQEHTEKVLSLGD